MPLFIALFILLLFSLHMLFYLSVIRRTLYAPGTKKGLTALLALNFLFNLLYIAGRYSDLLSDRFYYLFSLSIGISFVLLLYIILHEIIQLFHKGLKNIDRSKREFIKKTGDGMLFALATGYVAAGAYEGRKEPVVKTVDTGLFDFTIVQISDFHIGGLIDRDFVRHSVEKINALKPDLVVITGDLVDTRLGTIRDSVLELNAIASKHGIYYILGNHEYFHNPREIIAFARKETPFRLLLNDSFIIDTLKLNIVGLTDLFGYRMEMLEPDVERAFSGIRPEYKTLLLAHQPKAIEELGKHRPDLILSGHTHGGQIWPFNHLVALQQPYVRGLHRLPNGSLIYVNSGIGFWGPPMRLGSQAEITCIT